MWIIVVSSFNNDDTEDKFGMGNGDKFGIGNGDKFGIGNGDKFGICISLIIALFNGDKFGTYSSIHFFLTNNFFCKLYQKEKIKKTQTKILNFINYCII